jgi:hypothetical protein
MEDRLDDPQISALSPAIGPTLLFAGPHRIAMVAPPDERVGNIRRDHLHRPCDAPHRRSGALADKATRFTIQRASHDGPRRTAGSIVRAIAAQGGGRVAVIAMNASPQGWASRALWLMFAISAAWAVYVFGSHYGSCRADGTGELFCFVIALFFGWLEVLVFVIFVIVTVAKLLMLILP